MLADNSRHLVAAAQRRHDDAHQRAQEAIRVAAGRGEALSATTLANRAGVSRSFLYANPDLIEAIRELRRNGQRPNGVPARQGATDASLLRRLEALTERNKELRIENQDLRRRLEISHGRLRAQDQATA
ncbi:MAG TPA: DUF6262 family protein [Propionibacteriaceae bacterium]